MVVGTCSAAIGREAAGIAASGGPAGGESLAGAVLGGWPAHRQRPLAISGGANAARIGGAVASVAAHPLGREQ